MFNKIEYMRAYRRTNRKRLAEYMRAYRAKHPDSNTTIARKFRREHPKRAKEIVDKYRAKDPQRYKAQMALGWQVYTGKIKRPIKCSSCKKKAFVEGHHDDYGKPLEVRWLCKPCHTKQHSK